MNFLNILRILSLIVNVFLAGFVFYEIITNTLGIFSVIMLPVLFISTLMAILLPAKRKFKNVHKFFSSFIIWTLIMSVTLLAVFAFVKLRDSSEIIHAVSQYHSSLTPTKDFDLDFRKNGTFKMRSFYTTGEKVQYGKYKLEGDRIILLDDITSGIYKLNDTLVIQEKGIAFEYISSHKDKTIEPKPGILEYRILED